MNSEICSNCRYDLSATSGERCPECGKTGTRARAFTIADRFKSVGWIGRSLTIIVLSAALFLIVAVFVDRKSNALWVLSYVYPMLPVPISGLVISLDLFIGPRSLPLRDLPDFGKAFACIWIGVLCVFGIWLAVAL